MSVRYSVPVPGNTVAVVVLQPGEGDALRADYYPIEGAVPYPWAQTALALRLLADRVEAQQVEERGP